MTTERRRPGPQRGENYARILAAVRAGEVAVGRRDGAQKRLAEELGISAERVRQHVVAARKEIGDAD